MTKEVVLTLTGIQDGERIEKQVPATYYKKNGRHFVVFEESEEDQSGSSQTILRFTNEALSVHKKGTVNQELLFETGKRNAGSYGTALGTFELETLAKSVELLEEEEMISCHVRYALFAGGGKQDCEVFLSVRPEA